MAVTDQRKALDWTEQIRKLVDEDYPNAEKITLIMDNLNTHVGASLYHGFLIKNQLDKGFV